MSRRSAIEIESGPKFEALSVRQRLLTVLMLMFLGMALLSRFTHSPERWRSIEVSMSPQEISARLGAPTIRTTSEMRWREKRLLGNWELIAQRQGTQVTSLRKSYHWPGADRR